MQKSLITLLATLALTATTGVVMAQGAADSDVIEGEITRIDRAQRTITVRDDRDRQLKRFTIPEGTRVTVKGRTAELRDLRRGDGIVLSFRTTAPGPVVTRLQIPETPVSLEQRRAEPVAVETMPTALPKTAGVWPLVWLFGLAALGAGAGLRRLRKSI